MEQSMEPNLGPREKGVQASRLLAQDCRWIWPSLWVRSSLTLPCSHDKEGTKVCCECGPLALLWGLLLSLKLGQASPGWWCSSWPPKEDLAAMTWGGLGAAERRDRPQHTVKLPPPLPSAWQAGP